LFTGNARGIRKGASNVFEARPISFGRRQVVILPSERVRLRYSHVIFLRIGFEFCIGHCVPVILGRQWLLAYFSAGKAL
jgi:hypothetical protein